MGKKRRNYPNLDELLGRAWCYYCERDFEDLKLLISHQKAKHFKCERCGRRLNTAGGLSVHMNQVHKETLTHVENTLEGRDGLEVEIFGMEGIPEDAVVSHNSKIIEDFHKNRAERQAVTGNPPPGLPGSNRPLKKLKMETPEELKARLAAFRASGGAAAVAAAAAAAPPPNAPTGPAAAVSAAASAPGLPSRPPAGQFPPQFAGQFPPQFAGAPGELPQRPAYGGASTLDDLVSGAAAGAVPGGDVDHMTDKPEKSEKKKEKSSMRMVYADGDFSLEEKMAQMPRYAVAV